MQEIFFEFYVLGQSEGDRRFLASVAFTIYLLSFFGVLMECMQVLHRGRGYFKDSDNCFQLALYCSTIIFIHGFDNECWCSTNLQWQIGAIAVFLSWFNLIFILKYMPYTAITLNMFRNFYVTFLKLIYLPLMLILAFGISFYMVFVGTHAAFEVSFYYRRSELQKVHSTYMIIT